VRLDANKIRTFGARHADITDQGTVQLVELQPDHFVFQTVTSPETGTHPVSGARQFGFRRVGSNIVFYTEAAERPYKENLGELGRLAQDNTWRSFMTALGEMINHWGGVADLNTVRGVAVDVPCRLVSGCGEVVRAFL
jgi:hypothetical protein